MPVIWIVRSHGNVGEERSVADAERIYSEDSPSGNPSFIRGTEQQQSLFVGYDHGEPVAFAIVTQFFKRPFLASLFVRTTCRRKGIGHSMLEAVEQATAPDRLFVSTNTSNAAMLSLLEKRGYQRRGEIDGLDLDDPEIFLSLR